MTDPPAATSAVIEQDLLCLRCRYNLRTLAGAACCPECGLPVAESVAYQGRYPGGLRRRGAIVAFAVIALASDVLGGGGLAWSLWVNLRGFAATRADAALVYVNTSVNYLWEALALPAALILLWNAGPVRRASARVAAFRGCAVVSVAIHVVLDIFLGLAAVPIIVYLLSPPPPSRLVWEVYQLRKWVQVLGSPVALVVLVLLAVYLWDLARACRERRMQQFTVWAFSASLALALVAIAIDLADVLLPPGVGLAYGELLIRGLLVAQLGLAAIFAGFYWPGVIRMVRRAEAGG
ncbi:MAG TPA: hypothetical protein VH253_02670 [Phycisphaerae bacterium]|nr:hypothetical protein [Phycisphaerae bacterium]